MLHDDWLLRQLQRFALGVAEMAGVVAEDEDLEEECEALLGAPIEHFEAMSVHALLSLFPAHDAQTERRCLALAVGLAQRGADCGDDAAAAAARRRALALLDALSASGRSLTPEIGGLREALVRHLGEDPAFH